MGQHLIDLVMLLRNYCFIKGSLKWNRHFHCLVVRNTRSVQPVIVTARSCAETPRVFPTTLTWWKWQTTVWCYWENNSDLTCPQGSMDQTLKTNCCSPKTNFLMEVVGARREGQLYSDFRIIFSEMGLRQRACAWNLPPKFLSPWSIFHCPKTFSILLGKVCSPQRRPRAQMETVKAPAPSPICVKIHLFFYCPIIT